MSFSSDIKRGLCAQPVTEACCARAQLYGMLFFGRRFSGREIEMWASSGEILDTAARLCEETAGVIPSVRVSESGGGVLRVFGKKDTAKLLDCFGHDSGGVSYSLNYGNLDESCCMRSFLRGAFLVCGRVNEPSKGYRVEFSVMRVKAAAALETVLTNAGYPPLKAYRKNSCVLYYKDSETIEELLTGIGAVNGALELMNTKVYRDLRNRVNRLTNCEAANIGKTVLAARAQMEAIEKIRACGGIRRLPEELRQVARLRMSHPDASLSEIGRLCEPPLSRSGVNHRIARIMDAAHRMSASGGETGEDTKRRRGEKIQNTEKDLPDDDQR